MMKISYKIQDSANVTVKVVDILGTTVKLLNNVHDKPGTYEVNFDSDNFPIGKYYYKIFIKDALSENENPAQEERLLSSGQFKV